MAPTGTQYAPQALSTERKRAGTDMSAKKAAKPRRTKPLMAVAPASACSACGGSGEGPPMYRPEIDKVQRDRCYTCQGTGTKPAENAADWLCYCKDKWLLFRLISMRCNILRVCGLLQMLWLLLYLEIRGLMRLVVPYYSVFKCLINSGSFMAYLTGF